MDLDFSDKLQQIVREKLEYVAANKEKIVTAWVAETGLAPSESVLCVQNMADGSTRTWVERKTDFDECQALKAENAALTRLLSDSREALSQLERILDKAGL